MAKRFLNIKFFNGGIADSEKEGAIRGAFRAGKRLNIFGEPTNLSILPATVKISGPTVVDLVKWIVPAIPNASNFFYYGDAGHIYSSNTSGGAWADLRTVANSVGQGMDLYNDYMYYTQKTQLGRYGPLSGVPAFTDNWQTSLTDTSLSGFAPVKAFKEGFAVGHGNKLAWYDGSVWTLAKFTLPPGFNIRSLEIVDEFLAIGTWRGTSVTDSEDNYIFLWDGSAPTFNFFIPTDGPINALVNNKNRLVSMQGSNGAIYLNHSPFTKVHEIPNIAFNKYAEILPGAASTWRGQTHIGVAGNTDSADVLQGVYQWGSKSDKYAEVLNYAHTISTGTEGGTGMKIGAVKGVGNQLLIGWKDALNYGVDRVVNTGNPYASAIYEGLIFDDNKVGKQKKAEVLVATHKALLTGESIQLGYASDRVSYTTGTVNNIIGSTITRLPIDNSKSRFYEFNWEGILNASATTAPTFTSFGLLYDDLVEEEKI